MARTLQRTIELNRQSAERVRAVLEQNPELPMITITENGPDDYAWYYHEGVEASVDWLLFGEFCKDVPGIQYDKIYNDEDEVQNEIAEGLFESWWDCAVEHGMPNRVRIEDAPSDLLTDFCDAESNLGDFADTLARAISESLPWGKWVVVRAWL